MEFFILNIIFDHSSQGKSFFFEYQNKFVYIVVYGKRTKIFIQLHVSTGK